MKLKPSYSALILIGSAVLFIPFLGATHLFDWDEVNFAEASREMLVTGNYSIPQINFQPFWEKPPLFFWLQALSMKAFGVNEFAARFPNAICGIFTLMLLYSIGKRLVNRQFAWMWALVYAGSFLPHLYFKSGIIDPWYNLFIFLSVYYLARYSSASHRYSTRAILLSGIFAGLAVLTKGPVALLIIGGCYGVFAVLHRFQHFMKVKDILLFIVLAFAIGGIWFMALWLYGQQQIIGQFLLYQLKLLLTEDADHGGPVFYHVVVLLIGCFPAAALSLLSMRARRTTTVIPVHYVQWMQILFWVVLVLFSIVKTKIVHYSSLCYFPLTFLATASFYQLYQERRTLPAWNKWLQFATGAVLALAIITISLIDQLKPWLLQPGRIKDEFARANLQAHVHWNGLEWLPGMLLLGGVVFFVLRATRNIRTSLLVLFFVSIVAINLTITVIAPRVEPYSQGAAIEFYKSKQKERAIVETIGFKSYAHLFYDRRMPDLGKQVTDSILQFNTHPEVAVYYVGKIQNEQHDEQNLRLRKLYDKNGFVFYKLNRGAGLQADHVSVAGTKGQ